MVCRGRGSRGAAHAPSSGRGHYLMMVRRAPLQQICGEKIAGLYDSNGSPWPTAKRRGQASWAKAKT